MIRLPQVILRCVMCQSVVQTRTKVWTTLLPDVIESELKESYQQGRKTWLKLSHIPEKAIKPLKGKGLDQQGRKTWLKLSHIPEKAIKPLKGKGLWAKTQGLMSESEIVCEWRNVDKTLRKKYDSEAIGLYMKWKWHETNYQKSMEMEVTLSQVMEIVSNEETSESSIGYPKMLNEGESNDGGTKLISNPIIPPISNPIIPPISGRAPKLKSYQLFFRNTKETPVTGRKAFIMEAAAAWRSLSRKEKDMFHQMVGTEKVAAESEAKKLQLRERSLWKLINEEEREMYQELSIEEKERYSKEAKSIREPLRPFSIFLMEQKVSALDGAAVWKIMSPGEKIKYQIQAKRDRLRFMKECLERLKDKPTSKHIHERVKSKLSKDGANLYANEFNRIPNKYFS